MSESRRSFFSTIPGLITGLAGLLTGIVGLVTVLIQLGVLGGDDGGQQVGTTGTETTVTGGAPSSRDGGATTTTEPARLTVSPASLKLQPTEREKSIKVENPTRTATVTVLAPELTGADRAVFRADAGCTNVRLEPGRSCTLKVLFAPSGALRSYTATLVVQGERTRAIEVPIEATTIL